MPTTVADLRWRLLNARRQVKEAEEMAGEAERRGDGGRVSGERATVARARQAIVELEAQLAAAGEPSDRAE